MAVIPRNFGDGRLTSTPAINTVRMDPNVAAAPYRAAEQAGEQLQNVFGKELNEWGKVFQEEERARKAAEAKQAKVTEGLYKAEAMANIQVQANNMYNQMKQSSDGTQSFAPAFDQEFQKMAQQAIANAPTPEAKVDLTKRLIGTRSQLYTKATNESLQQNNQINMGKLEGMLGQYESLAAANPGSVEEIKKQSADVFASMGQLGIPEIARKKIMEKFDKRLDYHALRSEADLDPLGAMEKLKTGAAAHLGEGNTQALLNYTKSAIGATKSRIGNSLADLQNKISSGYAVPESYETVLQEAEKYGMSEKAQTVKSLLELDRRTASLPASELAVVASQLKAAAASGQVDADPKRVKALTNFLEGNAKAIKEDGLSYAERKGGFPPLPTVDLLKATDQELEDRKYKAYQVKDLYGTSTPALKQAEVLDVASKLGSMGPEDVSKVSTRLATLGQDTVEAVARAVEKSDKGLATVIRIGADNPAVVQSVVRGRALAATAPKDSAPMSEIIEAAGSFLINNPKLRDSYVTAARGYMLDSQARGSAVSAEEAMKEVAGVVKMDLPGMFTGNYKTKAPKPGMNASQFNNFLNTNLKEAKNWEQFATGVPADSNGNPIKWKNLDPADLVYHFNGSGNYSVIFNGNQLRDLDGKPISINLVGLANAAPEDDTKQQLDLAMTYGRE